MRTTQDLLTELNASDESLRIETKRAREIGKSIMETVIAFANEPGLGCGYPLLSVDWALDANGDTRYWAVTEEDYAWLITLKGDAPSADEAEGLIYVRETGLVDNMACRDFSGLDTLQASNWQRRLRDRGLLEKQGAGNRTHYTLVNPGALTDRHLEQGNRPFEGGKRDLPPLPPALAAKLPAPRQRMGEAALRRLIRDLCGWQALRGDELASLLGKDLKYLRNKHLSAMVLSGELAFQYPESPNHALQAYIRSKT